MVNGVNPNPNIDKLNQKNDVYQGSINPSFIPSNEPEPGETKSTTDSTLISSTTPGAVNSAMSSAIYNAGGVQKPEDIGYIKNTPTPPSPTPPSPPPPPPGDAGGVGGSTPTGGTSGDTSTGMDVAGDVDQGMDDFWNSVLNDPLYDTDINGFESLNGDKLEALYRQLLSLMNTRLFMMMFLEQRGEIRDMLFKAFISADLSDVSKKTSLVELTGKSNAKLAKFFQKGIAILMTNIKAHNDAVLAEKLKEADDAKGSGWDNYWSSNGDQEDALQMAEDAKKEYKDAMDRSIASLNRVFGGSFVGLTPETKAKGDEVMNDLKNSESHLTYDADGYVDTGAFKQYIVDLRNEFIGLLNVNRLVVSSARQKESMQKAMFEAITGKSGLSERLGGAEEGVESENAHQAVLFDQTASSILEVQKVKNDIKFIQKQIEKIDDSMWATVLGNIFEAVAIVATIVVAVAVSIVTWGSATAGAVAGAVALVALIVAVCAGVLAATFKYVGAEIGDAVDDAYDPSVDTYNPKMREKDRVKHSMLDQADELEYEEQMLVNGVGMGQIDTLSDDYLAVNNGQIANLTRQLNGLQNAMRVIAKMMKQQAEIRRMIQRALTGLSGGSASGNLTSAALEDVLKQMGMQFQALVSNLSEYKDAQNNEIQQAKAMEAARINFAVSMVTAVVAAIIGAVIPGVGGLMGALIGFSVGMTLGSAIAGMITASLYDTRNITYAPNVNDWRPIGSEGKGRTGSVLANLDTEAFNVYDELFSVGTCDAGDGNIGLNTNKIQAMQKRLENIFITIGNIASTIEAKSKMLKAIWQSLGVVTDETESISDMVRGNFETQMKVFHSAVSALSEKVEVANRANAAQQQYDNATTKLIVTVALLAVSAVIGGATGLTSVFNLCLSVTNLTVSAIDMINAWMRARNDTGELGTMAAQTTPEDAKSVKQKMSAEQQLLEKAEEIEAGISVNSGMIVQGGGGNYGINSGMFEVQNAALEKMNRIKELIGDIVNQGKDVKSRLARVLGGVRPNSPNAMDTAAYISSTIARAMLQTQMQAVQQLVGRMNQINQAEKNAILQSVSTGISAVQVALSVVNFAKTNGAMKEFKDMQKDIQSKPEAKDKWDQKEINRRTENYKEALKTSQNIGYVNLALSVVQTLIDSLLIASDHWSAGPDKNEKAVSESKNKENVAKSRQAISSAQGASVSSYGAQLDSMEAESTTLALDSGNADLDMQFQEILRNADTQLMNTSESHLKSLLGQATSLMDGVSKKDSAKLAVEYGKQRLDIQQKEDDFRKKAAMAAAADVRYAQAKQALETYRPEQQPDRANQPMSGRLEKLLADVENARREVDAAKADVVKSYKDWKESAGKLLTIVTAQNARLGKKTDLPPELQAMADDPVSDEKIFESAKKVSEGQPLDLTFETTIEGKKVDITLTMAADGTPKINYTNDQGKQVSMTLPEYAAIRETELKNKAQKADGEATIRENESTLADRDASKAEREAKETKLPSAAADAKEKRRIATEKKTIATEAREAHKAAAAKKYDLMQDEVIKRMVGQSVESYDKTSRAMARFMEDVTSMSTSVSQMSSEVSIEADKAMAAMNKMDEEVKEKRGNRELKELSAEELQSHYDTVYKEVFLPTRAELQQILKDKSQVNSELRQLKAEQKTEDDLIKAGELKPEDVKEKAQVRRNRIAELEVKMGDISSREGACRARIKSFNQYIGQINNEFRAKTVTTDNPKGKDLKPAASPDATTAVTKPKAEGKPTAGPEIAPSAGKPVSKPLSDPVVQAVLQGKVFIENGKVNVNGSGKMAVEDVVTKLKAALEDPRISKDQKAIIQAEINRLSTEAAVPATTPDKAEKTSTASSAATAESGEVKKEELKSGNIWKSEFAEDLRLVLAKVDDASGRLKGYAQTIEHLTIRVDKIKSFAPKESLTA